jgi:hypothetical protein
VHARPGERDSMIKGMGGAITKRFPPDPRPANWTAGAMAATGVEERRHGPGSAGATEAGRAAEVLRLFCLGGRGQQGGCPCETKMRSSSSPFSRFLFSFTTTTSPRYLDECG